MATAILSRPTEGQGVVIPAFPSKSEAHRLLIAAALADREICFSCSNVNEDISATMHCLVAMGAQLRYTDDGDYKMLPIGRMPEDPSGWDPVMPLRMPIQLNVGESGSTLRFLLPVVSALGITARLKLYGRLPQRPLAPLDAVLMSHGVNITRYPNGMLEVSENLRGDTFYIDCSISSQFASGLLFALPLLNNDSTLTLTGKLESKPYIDMTLDALSRFGVQITYDEKLCRFYIPGRRPYRAPEGEEMLRVGGDWSGAAFYLAAGAIGKQPVTVTQLDLNSRQGDREILELLMRMGAKCEIQNGGTSPMDSAITVYPSKLHGLCVDATNIPDLVPVLAVLCACAEGDSALVGVTRLRFKESDRIEAICNMLRAIGGQAEASSNGDALVIHPGDCALAGGVVDACNDHRIAMAAALMSLVTTGPVAIKGAEAVAKSAPNFFERMQQLAEVEYHV